MIEIKDSLRGFGLTEKEIQLYLKLLELGSVKSGRLMKGLSFYSKTVYEILDRLIEKGFLVLRINNTTFINTHLVHTYFAEKGHRNYEHLNNQLSQLLEFAKIETNNGKEVILGGDFNLEPESSEYNLITNFLIDQTLVLRPLANYKKTYPQRDYIFTSNGTSKNHMKMEYPLYLATILAYLLHLKFDLNSKF